MKTRLSLIAKLKALPYFTQNVVELSLASIGINLLALALPLTLLQVYDRIIPNHTHATLLWISAGCAVAMVMESLLRVARAFTGSWLAARLEHTVGTGSIDHFLSARLELVEGTPVGELLERLNASGILRHFYSGQLFQILLDIPFVILYLLAVFLIAGPLVLWMVGVIGIFLAVTFWMRKKFEKVSEGAEEAKERRQSFVIEVLGGMHAVRAQTFEEKLLRHYESYQREVSIAGYRLDHWANLPRLAGTITSQLMMFTTMVVGGIMVIHQDLTMGGLVACTMLSGRAMGPIQSSAGFFIHFAEARSATNHLEKIEALEKEAPLDAPPFPAEIEGQMELRDLGFSFPEGPTIFQGIDFRFPANSLTAISAAAGTGASSLLCCMMGLLTPKAGTVLVDGYDIHLWERTRLWGRIEYLPAEAVMFAGTILDNIARFDPTLRQIAQDAASMVGLDTLVAALPRGYDTSLDRLSSDRMSSGFVQRLALARALVVRPRILLCDRVDAAMDEETRSMFFEIISRLRHGCTIVMVTENERIVRMADQRAALRDGRLESLESAGVAR